MVDDSRAPPWGASLVLVLATGNIIVAFYAIMSIALIVASVLGAARLYAGWSLGVAESIAGVIVIGFSVDYTVHLGHIYKEAVMYVPDTKEQKTQHALVVIDDKGRGYTWIAGSKEERDVWLNAFKSTLQGVRQDVHDERPSALVSSMQLRDAPRKNREERAAAVMGGTRLIKYNQRDGHAAPRWVALSADRRTIVWGDVRSGAAGAYAVCAGVDTPHLDLDCEIDALKKTNTIARANRDD